MAKATPLHWSSLQTQLNIILTQLSSLSQVLTNYSTVLSKTVVYPLPEFPTTEQETLLMTLLRKKQMPEVAEWIESSKKSVESLNNSETLLVDDEKLIDWCLTTSNKLRELIDLDADDVVKTSHASTASHPTLTVDQVLKFTSQGVLPEDSTAKAAN